MDTLLIIRVPRYHPQAILKYNELLPNERSNVFGWRFVTSKRNESHKTVAEIV